MFAAVSQFSSSWATDVVPLLRLIGALQSRSQNQPTYIVQRHRIMIQLHVDILQNLQQASLIFQIPSTADCVIQTDRVVIDDEEGHSQTIVHLSGLQVNVQKGAEILSSNVSSDGHVRRAFKFPFVQLPKLTNTPENRLSEAACHQCHSPLTILNNNRTLTLVQQQNTNADDISEVMYCHRFCDAHEHKDEHHYEPPTPVDLHSDAIVLETTDCLIIAREHFSTDLIQCQHCSTDLGSLNPKTNLVSLNKCSLLPYSSDYLSSCFRHCEPGRYIVKVPKSNAGVFLLWVLPNQIISGSIDLLPTNTSSELQFHRKRKILLASSDDPLLSEWKRDFSVVTLLVTRLCLEHLASVFHDGIRRFPHHLNSEETFQSLTISLGNE